MKRSTSSINDKRDVTSSRSKRLRSSTTMRQEEDKIDTVDDHVGFSSEKKILKKKSQHDKENSFNDQLIRDNDSIITASTPSRSSISFSSSSSKSTASSTNNKKSERNTSESLQLQHTANGSAVSRTNSSKKILSEGNTNASSTSLKATGNVDRTAPRPNSQARSLSSTSKNQITNTQNSTRGSTYNNLSTSYQSSSSNDLTNLAPNSFPVQALVEGSAEFRELKRLYVREKNQVEEWRKDYKVLKRQLAYLKSTTIPRPSAEVFEWLQELFDLMNNNGAFGGDGRTLNEIGKELGLDAANLIAVAARTPQKSALKLFRLLYPTIGSRAECGSVSKIPSEKLQNIYVYIRKLHPNLNFNINDMKKAIGVSIRSAKSELRKLERYGQQQLNVLQIDENIDPDERDERIEDAIRGIDAVLHATDAASDDDDDDDDEDKEDEDEEDDKEMDNLLIDDEIDEADDEE